MELYVLRHGTTDWNREKRLQGRTDIPLDAEGVRLAEETARGMRDIRFDAVYSSPLKRAYDTCRIVLGDRDMEIRRDDRLMEADFGDWEGRVSSEVSGELPKEEVDAFFDLRLPEKRVPNGESVWDVIRRTGSFVEELLNDPENGEKRILLSMHGCSGRALMHYFWQDDLFWHGALPPNCSVTIVRLKGREVLGIEMDRVFYEEPVRSFYDFVYR